MIDRVIGGAIQLRRFVPSLGNSVVGTKEIQIVRKYEQWGKTIESFNLAYGLRGVPSKDDWMTRPTVQPTTTRE